MFSDKLGQCFFVYPAIIPPNWRESKNLIGALTIYLPLQQITPIKPIPASF